MGPRTGIFFYYQQALRLADFPAALEGILEQENVFLYDAVYEQAQGFILELVAEPWLSQVHRPEMIETIRQSDVYLSALYSASGAVQAALKILAGEMDNAFVFTGFGDHHSGPDFWGGGCYFNGAALAIAAARAELGARRFAIVDTDAHHGDGTWALFADDPQVLYLCLCPGRLPDENNNVNITVPFPSSDAAYQKLVAAEVLPRLADHRPEIIFWNYGYDALAGDYGDLGLSRDCPSGLAELLVGAADALCRGRLAVILCGGARPDLATYTIPGIIRVLAKLTPV